MTDRRERRRYTRTRVVGLVDLIWNDESGHQQTESGRMVDCSLYGAGVESSQSLAASSLLILRAPEIGIVALSQVRNCSWWRTQYRLGIQFLEKAAIKPTDPAAVPDYHELLLAGMAGELRRMDQLYGELELRYGPDNRESGDSGIFLRITQAYRILAFPQPHQAESGTAKPLGGFGWPEGLHKLKDKRIETDEVGFIVWYLREKGAVELNDYSANYAISAVGVDILESAQAALEEVLPTSDRHGTQSGAAKDEIVRREAGLSSDDANDGKSAEGVAGPDRARVLGINGKEKSA
jgi:hypothetical protein